MNNSINSAKEKTNSQQRNSLLTRLWTIVAISLALSSCSSPQERIQKLENEVAALEHTLLTESTNYGEIAKQQNIQIDLRDEWADQTINQEIGYATERALSYDSKIAKTKEKLAKKQKKLANLKEKYIVSTTQTSQQERLNPTKYNYIPEEYRRSGEN